MVTFCMTLVRHGETQANKEHVIQGQQNIPLSDVGLEQARLLGEHLREERFTHLLSSDLSRAMQTAEQLLSLNWHQQACAALGHVPTLHQEPLLRERCFGVIEGQNFEEMTRLAQQANQSLSDFTPQGAETVQDVHDRAVRFFQELCERLVEENQGTEDGEEDGLHVLVVSHGGLLRELVRHLVEDRPCQPPLCPGQTMRISPNTGLSRFQVTLGPSAVPTRVHCLVLHDRSHLLS